MGCKYSMYICGSVCDQIWEKLAFTYSIVVGENNNNSIFKPGACSLWPRMPGFLKLLWFMHRHVCVSVCPPQRPLITSGMIWCGIDRVWLVKQALWLFPAFNYFMWHLPSIKWIGMAILTQHVGNTCQRKLRWCDTSYKRTTKKTECFIYESEWVNE